MVFQRSFKGVSRKFKKRFNKFSTVLQGKLKDVLGDSGRFWEIQGDSRESQGNLEEVLTVFQGSFKGVKCVSGKSQKFLRMFH